MVLRKKFNKISIIILLTGLVLFLSYSNIYAQEAKEAKEDRFPFDQQESKGKPSISERLFFGGNIGLQFGTYTQIEISPIVGIWLMPRIAVAIGPTYRYYKDQYNATDIYGVKSYMEFMVIQDINRVLPMGVHTGIFFHAEDEWLSLKTSYWQTPPYENDDRFSINTVLIGGGLSQQIGRRSSLNFTILWPINESVYALYSNPEIRISFNF